jgi:iron complex transport system substrate-binding protein
MRVVSLACSNTEIVAALGCADVLVGVDHHSDHPAEVVARLPRVGPDLNIDIAAVAALKPDLVLCSLTVPGHETVVEGIEAAGLPHLVLAPEGLGDVPPSIREIARALAPADAGVVARGEALARSLQAAFEAGPSPETGFGTPTFTRPSVLVQWWPKPVIAPGNRSWVHDLITLSGGRNVLEEDVCLSRPLDDLEVAARNPDLIVVSWCGVHPDKYRPEVVRRNPAFNSVAAVRNNRVVSIPEAFLGRPGPRLLEGLAALTAAIRETPIGTDD